MTVKTRFTALAMAAVLWPAAAGAVDYLSDANRLAAAGDLPAARLQLRNAVKANDHDAAAHYRLGAIDLQLGDPTAAEKEAQAAKDLGYDQVATTTLLMAAYLGEGRARDLLRDFPPNPAATPDLEAAIQIARGRASMVQGHPDQAESAFLDAQRLQPNSAEPLIGLAQLALSRHDMAVMALNVDQALKLAPNSAVAWQLRANLLTARQDQAGAIAAADKAVALAPGEMSYRLDRAGVLIAFNQNEAAQADLAAVLAVVPGSARATYYRAIIETRAGNYKAADTDLNSLSDFISRFPDAYLLEAVVKQQVGQTEQALDAATRYNARNPAEPRGAIVLASLYLAGKQPRKALDVLKPLIDANTTSPDVYDLHGTALNQLGRPQEALKDFQKVNELRPNNARSLAQEGLTELALRQTAGAAALLDKSAALAPNAQTQAALTLALIDGGNYDQAQKTIDQIRAADANSVVGTLLEGTLRLGQFDLAGAQQQFEAVLKADPNSLQARAGLARTYLLQGRLDDWLTQERAILQRDPAHEPDLDQATARLMQTGQQAEAVKLAEAGHAAAASDLAVLKRLVELYVATGQGPKAMDVLNATAGTPGADGTVVSILMLKALTQDAMKQSDAALGNFRQALALQPRFVAARLQVARLQMATDPAAARATLNEGLLLDPKNQPLQEAVVRADVLGGGSFAAGLATAMRLQKDQAYRPASLSLPADLYVSDKRYDDAAKAYAAALKEAPSTTLAIRLAGAQISGGHPDQATAGLRDWLVQHPSDQDAELLLSDLDIQLNQLAAAKTLLGDLITQRPNDVHVLNNLAWVDQQTNDPKALALAQRAYQLSPSPNTADTLGLIMATSNVGDRGVGLLKAAAEQSPDSPGIQYHLAVAYQAAGDTAAAVKVLTPLVTTVTDFPEKPQARQLLAKLDAKP